MRYSPASSSPLPRVTLYILGLTYMGLGGVMALMALAGLVLGQSWLGFLAGAAIGLTLGALFRGAGASKPGPRRAESLFAVALLWLAVPLLGAVPFWISGGMSYLDALFESMSGFTTTGATALADFKQFDQTLFFWRSLIQWFGGVGVLVLFIAVLPSLAVAGRQLFFAESTGVQKEAVLAAKRSIVTVEEIVDDFGPRSLNAVILPGWTIGAISVVPGGAFPSYAQGYYKRFNAFYKQWDGIARDRDSFLAWMKENVLDKKPEDFARHVEALRTAAE